MKQQSSPHIAPLSKKLLLASSSGVSIVHTARLLQGGPSFFAMSAGTPNLSGFTTATVAATNPNAVGFGFNGVNLLWSLQHVSGQAPGGVVTELTAAPSIDTFLLPGQSLASLNAEPGDIAEGAILWTSNGTAADTFIFSRLAPVPEPASALLCGLSILCLLSRRRY